jgi:hypothetical protein
VKLLLSVLALFAMCASGGAASSPPTAESAAAASDGRVSVCQGGLSAADCQGEMAGLGAPSSSDAHTSASAAPPVEVPLGAPLGATIAPADADGGGSFPPVLSSPAEAGGAGGCNAFLIQKYHTVSANLRGFRP